MHMYVYMFLYICIDTHTEIDINLNLSLSRNILLFIFLLFIIIIYIFILYFYILLFKNWNVKLYRTFPSQTQTRDIKWNGASRKWKHGHRTKEDISRVSLPLHLHLKREMIIHSFLLNCWKHKCPVLCWCTGESDLSSSCACSLFQFAYLIIWQNVSKK